MFFTLKGVNKASGETLHEQIEAATSEAAAEAARERGIEIVEVAAVADSAPVLALSYDTPTVGPIKPRLKALLLMLFLELLPLMGLVLWDFRNSGASDPTRYLTLLAVFFFLIIQAGILVPVLRPRAGYQVEKSAWHWLSAIALGLILGIVAMSAIFLALDYYWATAPAFTNSQRDTGTVFALFIAAASWLISIPLIMAFMKRGRPESVLARLAAALFLGSAIEVIASLPIMELARRRDSCMCGNLSFWSIVFSTMTGFIVLGPMIFLVIVARRTRAASHCRCPVCGHNLRPLANRDRCPKCGAGWKG